MDNEKIINGIFWITAAILIFLEFLALGMNSHYKFDFIFLMLLLVGLFYLRKKIGLHWSHFLLYCMFLLIHDVGMFKTYEITLSGIEYDYMVHLFFGMVAALILMRTYHHTGTDHGFMKYIMVIVIVLGFSAAHELYEFGGAILLGEGEGVLFIGAGDLDEWDTQKDMLNNFIGGLLGMGLYALTVREKR